MHWVRLSLLPEAKSFNKDHPDSLDWEIRDGSVWFQGRNQLRNADSDSFEFLDDEHTFIARDCNHVFHASSKVTALDVATFESLGDRYYRDKDLVYLEYETSIKPLKGRDVANFSVLGNGYARDSVHGYFWGTPIRKCVHPLALEVIPDGVDTAEGYARDDQLVYYEGAALKDVDVATWQLLPLGFSRDAKSVFHGASRLPRVRVGSWQYLERAYSKDEKTVYLMQFPLKAADPAQFRILRGEYSTDGTHVYQTGQLLEDADASTFQVDENGRAFDKHGAFDERGCRAKD